MSIFFRYNYNYEIVYLKKKISERLINLETICKQNISRSILIINYVNTF